MLAPERTGTGNRRRVKKGMGRSTVLSSFFSLCFLPMQYIGKFKIYAVTMGSRMPKKSLNLQHNRQKFLLFGTLKPYSNKRKVT